MFSGCCGSVLGGLMGSEVMSVICVSVQHRACVGAGLSDAICSFGARGGFGGGSGGFSPMDPIHRLLCVRTVIPQIDGPGLSGFALDFCPAPGKASRPPF